MRKLALVRDVGNYVLQKINAHAGYAEKLSRTFSIFWIITYPLYYLAWTYLSPHRYRNVPMYLIGIFLCVILLLRPYWPKKCGRFFLLYWNLALLYIIPFSFTFFLLKDNFSNVLVLNTMTVMVLLVLLVDTVSLFFMLIIGVSLGCLVYYITTGPIQLPRDYFLILMSYVSILIFSVLFVKNRERTQQEKQLEVMSLVSSSIAHEIRTPLATLNAVAMNLKKYFPILFDAYRMAKQAGLPVGEIRQKVFLKLEKQPLLIEVETNATASVIDLLLINIQSSLEGEEEIFSMSSCVEEALSSYPFRSEQRKMIRWDPVAQNDFFVLGKKILVIHVLFNLLRNALYYLEQAGKGEVSIWLESEASNNVLYFKDTGMGIAKKDLPHIFDRFFTRTRHGAGIGLAFCKLVMKSFKGSISCKSEVNVYTLFKLCFPKKNSTKED